MFSTSGNVEFEGIFAFSSNKIRLEAGSINHPAYNRREQVGKFRIRRIWSGEGLPDLGVCLDFDINAPIVVGGEELR